MKIFIAQAMHGRTDADILQEREYAIDYIGKTENESLEVIDQFHVDNPPDNAGRLWYLGRSIQKLSEADKVYFIGKWWKAKGCVVEKLICTLYHINNVNQYDVLHYTTTDHDLKLMHIINTSFTYILKTVFDESHNKPSI